MQTLTNPPANQVSVLDLCTDELLLTIHSMQSLIIMAERQTNPEATDEYLKLITATLSNLHKHVRSFKQYTKKVPIL